MRLVEFTIGEHAVKITRTFLGNEKVFLNDHLVSQKRTLFGTNHTINIDDLEYTIKYTVKDWQKKWTGQPTFKLVSKNTVIYEHQISNSTFFSIQFILSFVIFYSLWSLLNIFITSAQHGFVFNAY